MNMPLLSQKKNNRCDMLLEILDNSWLYPHFQPIVDLHSRKVIGHEALIRGPLGGSMESPSVLFSTAIEYGLLHRLELSSCGVFISYEWH